MEKSVHMHTDDFYRYLSKGAIPPHLSESNEQNMIVVEAFLEAARRFVCGGYDVVVDGIVGPWFLGPWLGIAQEGCEVHYIILRAGKEETLERAVRRSKLDRETNIGLVEPSMDDLMEAIFNMCEGCSQDSIKSKCLVHFFITRGTAYR